MNPLIYIIPEEIRPRGYIYKTYIYNKYIFGLNR